jgi:hypothetical protein
MQSFESRWRREGQEDGLVQGIGILAVGRPEHTRAVKKGLACSDAPPSFWSHERYWVKCSMIGNRGGLPDKDLLFPLVIVTFCCGNAIGCAFHSICLNLKSWKLLATPRFYGILEVKMPSSSQGTKK